MAPTFGSALAISVIGYIVKGFSKVGTKKFEVRGLPTLLEALRENEQDVKGKGKEVDPSEKPKRRGIVTVCNHNSVLDDPLTWAMLPLSSFYPFASSSHVSRSTRWSLGARDIMFTNPVFRQFFAWGQVLDTERGGGVFQPAVDEAVKLVQNGEWLHIFPEGKVNQEKLNPPGGLIRFKWGVSRIIMDSEVMPEIIPMWISHFDEVMPETRGWPRFLPRLGARISITIGQSLTPMIRPLVTEWRKVAETQAGTVGIGGQWKEEDGSPPSEHQRRTRDQGVLADGKEKEMRIKICEVLQESVRKLGVAVEEEEGRFERKEWCQSTPNVHSKSA